MTTASGLRSWLRRALLGCLTGVAMAGAAWAQGNVPAMPMEMPPEVAPMPALNAGDTPAQTPAPAHFNAAFLASDNDAAGATPFSSADLDTFAYGNAALPGMHKVEVHLNDVPAGSHNVLFVTEPNVPSSAPCVTSTLLNAIGVELSKFPAVNANAPQQCINVNAQMPLARFTYDADMAQLNITVPDSATRHLPRGAIDPAEWQNGINAALFDYRVSGAKNYVTGFDTPNDVQWYASLRSGINLGPWRLRSTASLNHDPTGTRLQFQNIYARRAFTSIKGEFTIGDAVTQGNIFDSVPFRGVQLASDDSMEPDSLRGYAPVVRGIAQTHAKVELRQNGFLIYSTYVPPGPFRIDDLYATASNADIQVTIIEADGQKRTFVQPFSSVPALLREHAWRYNATAGVLRVPGATRSPTFVQATLAHGLGGEVTLYGGVTASSIYQAAVFGIARNMPVIGALSLDLTHARSRLPDGHVESGQSLRLMYDKSLDSLGTQFRVAGYRYSTQGYHTLPDLVQPDSVTPFTLSTTNARDRFELNVSQSLNEAGSIYASYTQQGYWGQPGRDRVIQVGYNNTFRNIAYGLNLSYDHHIDGTASRQIAFNVAIPLGKDSNHSVTASMLSADGDVSEGTGISGTLLNDHRLSYSVRTDHSQYGGMSGSASVNYLSSMGEIGITHNQARGSAQTSIEAAGGVVVHPQGITLSQPLGETVALVAAPGAADVGIEANPGLHTDGAGYAVVPNLTPYRRNELTLHTADLGKQTAVRTATRIVTPKRGAVVVARYKVSKGRMLIDIKDVQGKPAPFGARIETLSGDEVGMVGPDGQGFVTGAGTRGKLRVRWGQHDADQCTLSFNLGQQGKSVLPETSAVCSPPQTGAAALATIVPAPPSPTRNAS